MTGEAILVILILIGILGHSNIIATSACMLLILKLSNLQRFYPLLERRGLEAGLLFLTISVLVPFASGRISWEQIKVNCLTVPGVIAFVGGALATYMNGQGLELLQFEPELLLGLVLGSIFGIVFLKGVPVGPLMAAGLTALFFNLFKLLFK